MTSSKWRRCSSRATTPPMRGHHTRPATQASLSIRCAGNGASAGHCSCVSPVAQLATASATRRSRRSGAPGAVPDDRDCPRGAHGRRHSRGCLCPRAAARRRRRGCCSRACNIRAPGLALGASSSAVERSRASCSLSARCGEDCPRSEMLVLEEEQGRRLPARSNGRCWIPPGGAAGRDGRRGCSVTDGAVVRGGRRTVATRPRRSSVRTVAWALAPVRKAVARGVGDASQWAAEASTTPDLVELSRRSFGRANRGDVAARGLRLGEVRSER
jgi:hypothetical protein